MKHGTSEQLREALIASGTWDDYAQKFCDEACLQRYLRARNMDVTKAHAMLKATLEWRKENKVDDLTIAEFANSKYMRDGWVYVDGNDAAGRSVVVFRKRKDKIPLHEADEYMRYMMFVLETAVKNMKNGQEQWIWLLDLAAYSPSNAPALSITLGVLNMLSNHYPERLYKGYVVNAPSLFSVAWKVLYPFIDPVTRSKAEFVHTQEYHTPAKSGASHSSSWGSWASSMFHHKSSSSTNSSSKQQHHEDAAVVVTDECEASIAAKAGGTFAPFLTIFETPYCYNRHQRLLAAVGWSNSMGA